MQSETTSSQATFERFGNIILEGTLATIVGKTLAKLDDGDKEDGKWKFFSHTVKGFLLALIRLAANRSLKVLLAGSGVIFRCTLHANRAFLIDDRVLMVMAVIVRFAPHLLQGGMQPCQISAIGGRIKAR